MSRKQRKQKKRSNVPDSKYKSLKVSKFINRLMVDGKKRIAEAIVYEALEGLSKEVGVPVVEGLDQVLKNVIPMMEVKSRRVGGSTYQVPIEVRSSRGLSLGIKWIILNSRAKTGKPMAQKLMTEMIDAYNNTGTTVKKREDTHKMAEANKAFAHFRW